MAYYDTGYAPLWNPILVADMVELLTQPEPQWFEIEELLAHTPRELQFARLLQASQSRVFVFPGQARAFDFALDEDARQILIHRVFPYATLLDTRLTPLQQAAQLHRVGVEVDTFCLWVQASPLLDREPAYAVYRDTAREALTAWTDHYSLLRGAERAPEAAEQLLRAAATTLTPPEELLQPSSAQAALPLQQLRSVWWRRLFAKGRFRKHASKVISKISARTTKIVTKNSKGGTPNP